MIVYKKPVIRVKGVTVLKNLMKKAKLGGANSHNLPTN